jgi:hypothetical protein
MNTNSILQTLSNYNDNVIDKGTQKFKGRQLLFKK